MFELVHRSTAQPSCLFFNVALLVATDPVTAAGSVLYGGPRVDLRPPSGSGRRHVQRVLSLHDLLPSLDAKRADDIRRVERAAERGRQVLGKAAASIAPRTLLGCTSWQHPIRVRSPPPTPLLRFLAPPLLTQQGSTGLTTPFSVLTAMAAQSTPSPAGNPPLHSFGNTEAKYQRQTTPFTSFSGTGPVFYRVSAQGRFTAVADQSRNVTFSALPRPIGCIQTTCCNCPFRVDSGNTVRLADDSLLLVMNVFYQPKTGARRERESARACERETGRQGDRDRDRETESGGHTHRDTERERVCTA